MLRRPLVAEAHKRADRSGRGIEDVDLVAVDKTPESVGLGEIRRAFVQHRGGAVLQRPVNDVTMAGNPSDIGRAPEDVIVLQVEHPLSGDISANGVTSRGM